MKKNNLFILLFLAVSLFLFAGGVFKKISHLRKAEKKGTVIAIVPKGTINMWWEVVHKGALKAAAEENVTITWNGPEVETDREKQIQALEDALIQKVSAVVFAPNDSKAMIRSVEKVKEQKIPCVLIDAKVDADIYDSFAGTDGYAGGVAGARLIGKALSGKGEVILMHFVQGSSSTDARGQGFKDTLKKEFPGVRVVAEQYTLGTVDDARQKAVDLLTRFPKTNGMFAVNHPSSVGTYKAIQNQKLAGKVKFVGFDSDPILLEGIEKGEVLAVIAQNPFAIGYTGVKTAMKLLRKEKVDKNIMIPAMVVDKTNLEAMKKEAPEALGL